MFLVSAAGLHSVAILGRAPIEVPRLEVLIPALTLDPLPRTYQRQYLRFSSPHSSREPKDKDE